MAHWWNFLFKRNVDEDADRYASDEEEANYYGLTVEEYRRYNPEELDEHQRNRLARLAELEEMGEPIYDHRGEGAFLYHTDEHGNQYNYEQAVRDDLPWYKHGKEYHPARASWGDTYPEIEQEIEAGLNAPADEAMDPWLENLEADECSDEFVDTLELLTWPDLEEPDENVAELEAFLNNDEWL